MPLSRIRPLSARPRARATFDVMKKNRAHIITVYAHFAHAYAVILGHTNGRKKGSKTVVPSVRRTGATLFPRQFVRRFSTPFNSVNTESAPPTVLLRALAILREFVGNFVHSRDEFFFCALRPP